VTSEFFDFRHIFRQYQEPATGDKAKQVPRGDLKHSRSYDPRIPHPANVSRPKAPAVAVRKVVQELPTLPRDLPAVTRYVTLRLNPALPG